MNIKVKVKTFFIFFILLPFLPLYRGKMVGLAGLEPATNWLWANCSNHWATGPYIVYEKTVTFNGGKTGIRTLGTRRFTPLAGEPIRPLWHLSNYTYKNKNGGETGIRTLGTVASTTVFKTVAFDHSAISPRYICIHF